MFVIEVLGFCLGNIYIYINGSLVKSVWCPQGRNDDHTNHWVCKGNYVFFVEQT